MNDASSEQMTCGKGLAANAALPKMLGALMATMADLLANHLRSLPSGDASADLERHAYERLINDQRSIAALLNGLAAAMKSHHDLPPAPHDESVLDDKRSRDVFVAFIDAEENGLTLLQEQTREYRAILESMEAGRAK
jgi:hypothetical protein